MNLQWGVTRPFEFYRWRDCYSDEHYIPTLLAYNLMSGETDCSSNLVYVEFAKGTPHAMAIQPSEITVEKYVYLTFETALSWPISMWGYIANNFHFDRCCDMLMDDAKA